MSFHWYIKKNIKVIESHYFTNFLFFLQNTWENYRSTMSCCRRRCVPPKPCDDQEKGCNTDNDVDLRITLYVN